MDPFVNEKDDELLAQDKYTFAVLDRILRGPCDLIRSNHQNVILCHSEKPYPVWIWTPDNSTEEIFEKAWSLADELRPFSDGYRFNIKHELAEYFINKARQSNQNICITMQLYAYDCPHPIQPDCPADGKLYCCTPDDIETAATMMASFYTDIGEEPPPKTRITEKLRMYMNEQSFFFWKNREGAIVACCSYKHNQGLASLGSVYTKPEYRRKHYAQHLVYQVTDIVKKMGYMPMLYTDADYPASNACYEKIGYTLRGRLCTIAMLR